MSDIHELVQILLVEDNPGDVRLTQEALKEAKFRNTVHVVGDGVEALAYLRQHGKYSAATRPHMVMLDLNMPHVGGLAVMKQLSGVIPETDYLPVLVLSGDDTPETKANAVAHGASDFLSKPLNRIEVRLRVRNLLQTRHLHVQLQSLNAALEEQSRERTELADRLAKFSAPVAH